MTDHNAEGLGPLGSLSSEEIRLAELRVSRGFLDALFSAYRDFFTDVLAIQAENPAIRARAMRQPTDTVEALARARLDLAPLFHPDAVVVLLATIDTVLDRSCRTPVVESETANSCSPAAGEDDDRWSGTAMNARLDQDVDLDERVRRLEEERDELASRVERLEVALTTAGGALSLVYSDVSGEDGPGRSRGSVAAPSTRAEASPSAGR